MLQNINRESGNYFECHLVQIHVILDLLKFCIYYSQNGLIDEADTLAEELFSVELNDS